MIIPNIWKNKKCSKPPTSYSVNPLKDLFRNMFSTLWRSNGFGGCGVIVLKDFRSPSKWLSPPLSNNLQLSRSGHLRRISKEDKWWKPLDIWSSHDFPLLTRIVSAYSPLGGPLKAQIWGGKRSRHHSIRLYEKEALHSLHTKYNRPA